jgi:hypothetical protein
MFGSIEGLAIGLVIGLVVRAFFLYACQQCLREISPENRSMPPGQVWLGMIPLFNIIWNFIMVNAIANSLSAEHLKRNIPSDSPRPTYNTGMGYSVATLIASIPFSILPLLAGIPTLVLFIMYWVQVYNQTQTLKQNPYMEGDLLRDM